MDKQYLIEFTAFDNSNQIAKEGKIVVKKCANEFHAKVKLEKFIKKKFPKTENIVIHSCKEDNYIMQQFRDIFNGKI